MPLLRIKRPAEKDILDLAPDTRARVIATIQALRENPLPHGTEKLQGRDREYRLRLGTYRILYEFDPAAGIISIYRVKHRREVYR